jgi:hypothetical protein
MASEVLIVKATELKCADWVHGKLEQRQTLCELPSFEILDKTASLHFIWKAVKK